MTLLKNLLKKGFYLFGCEIRKIGPGGLNVPKDFDPEVAEIVRNVSPYTLTSPEAINALVEAARYIVKNRIQGSIVECGVWRGGSMMAIAQALVSLDECSRECFLFDTFEGMSRPGENDYSVQLGKASGHFKKVQPANDSSDWCRAGLEEVRNNLAQTHYDEKRLHFIKGKVEDTLPEKYSGGRIALLRLDTDWYESTKHELTHLFPLLSEGGVLIIDDYGFWEGCKKAVDEYVSEHQIPILLNRVDHTVRIAIKTSSDLDRENE